jgi:ribosomal protein L7/L12
MSDFLTILINQEDKARILKGLHALAEEYGRASSAMATDFMRAEFERDAREYRALATRLTEALGKMDLDKKVRALYDSGRRIEAIKLVRYNTNLGLKEAKDYVEKLAGVSQQEAF